MKKNYLKVRLFVPNPEGFCRLRAHITKGKEVPKKYITSDIAAQGRELLKFTETGEVKPGEFVPLWLKLEVAAFYAVANAVALEYDNAGKLKQTKSEELADRAKELLITSRLRVEVEQQGKGL